jgi:galactosylceramidase
MGRINDVGNGYGCIPKGYFLQLTSDGQCRLAVIRGQTDEQVLRTVQLPNIGPNQWHKLQLRFDGPVITGFIDAALVLSATDAQYSHGMAGLMAGGDERRLSMPYFDNVLIKDANDPTPAPSPGAPGQTPIYGDN